MSTSRGVARIDLKAAQLEIGGNVTGIQEDAASNADRDRVVVQ